MPFNRRYITRIFHIIPLIAISIWAQAQCPTEAQLEGGGTVNIPTNGDCSSAVSCSITSANFWDINGNITVQSCATLDLNQNSSFLYILGGTFTVEEGATLNTNRRIIVDGATLIVNGQFNVGDGAGNDNLVVTGGGSITVGSNGNIDVGNGNVRVGSNGANSGSLTVNGTLSTSGNLVIRNTGGLSGSGTVTYGGNFTSSGTTNGSFTSCSGSNTSCGDSSLPVELVTFKTTLTRDGAADLHWETATELNNEGFHVEKSSDGLHFESIGFVPGNGTSNQTHYYNFQDESLSTSSYYRLKQVDYDGQFEYSPVSFVKITSTNSVPKIGIYPNPVVSNFQFTESTEGVFDWTLMSITGQKIITETNLTVAQAEVRLNQSLGLLDAGTYLIIMQNSETRQHIRMLKQ